jgi:hypothetical protein
MSSLRARGVALSLGVILSLAMLGLPLTAQSSSNHLESSSYHLETDDRMSGWQQVFLVNDSEKPIEAYAAYQHCQAPPKPHSTLLGSSALASEDILSDPHLNGISVHLRTADGGLAPHGVLEKGERWITFLANIPERGDCQNKITAVLFSDGSFEGEDAAVRGIKASRDGWAAGVHYWADRIGREKPDGSTLAALLAEVKQRKTEDQSRMRKYPEYTQGEDTSSLLWHYWASWANVELILEPALTNDLKRQTPSDAVRRITDEINEWKKKIDGNLALQKLNMVFPPISDSGESPELANK